MIWTLLKVWPLYVFPESWEATRLKTATPLVWFVEKSRFCELTLIVPVAAAWSRPAEMDAKLDATEDQTACATWRLWVDLRWPPAGGHSLAAKRAGANQEGRLSTGLMPARLSP